MAGWIGAAISAAGGLASGLVGAIQGRKSRKRERQRIENERRDALNLFNHDYYQDLTQRSDMQYLLGQQRKRYDEATDRARRTEVVAGKTGEAAVNQKQTAAQGVADSTAKIGYQNEQHKKAALNRYVNQNADLNRQQHNLNVQQAQQGANLMANGAVTVSRAGGAIADSIWNNDTENDVAKASAADTARGTVTANTPASSPMSVWDNSLPYYEVSDQDGETRQIWRR